MMKKKHIGLLVIIVVLAILFIDTLLGARIQMGNMLFIGGSYYSDPQEAFWNSYSTGAYEKANDMYIKSLNDVALINIDEYNSLYIAIDQDNLLVLGDMRRKDDRYCASGNNTRIGADQLSECSKNPKKSEMYKKFKYDKNGIGNGEYYYCVAKIDETFSVDEESYIVYKYENVENFPAFAVVVKKE